MTAAARPGADEYSPYFGRYIGRVADHENILEVLETQREDVLSQIGQVPETRGDYRYAPGKWTIKEVLGHLSDAERIFAYRALRMARGDTTPLPGFEEDDYVPPMEAATHTLAERLEEWDHVRLASLDLFRLLPPAAWTRRGMASDQPFSVRALAYVIAGHTRHHLETLRTRYQV